MKHLLKLPAMLAVLFCSSWAKAQESESAASFLPPELRSYYLTCSASIEGGLADWKGQGQLWLKYVQGNWRSVLAAWERQPPTSSQKNMLIVTAEALPPIEYVAYLGEMADIFERGGISEDSYADALFGNMKKQGFIGDNYSAPVIQTLLKRSRSLFKNQSHIDYCNDCLAGANYAQFAYLDDQPESLPGHTPKPPPWMLIGAEQIPGEPKDIAVPPGSNELPPEVEARIARFQALEPQRQAAKAAYMREVLGESPTSLNTSQRVLLYTAALALLGWFLFWNAQKRNPRAE